MLPFTKKNLRLVSSEKHQTTKRKPLTCVLRKHEKVKNTTNGSISKKMPTIFINSDSTRDQVCRAVAAHGWMLKYASPELKNDQAVVFRAISQSGLALEHASASFRGTRGVVLAAVLQNGEALEFASGWFKNDRGIVLAAVGSAAAAFRFASDQLRGDMVTALSAINNDGRSILLASKSIQECDVARTLAARATRRSSACDLKNANSAIQNCRPAVLSEVEKDGFVLLYASEVLKADAGIVLAAVKAAHRWANVSVLAFAAADLQTDAFLVGWNALTQKGRRYRRLREAFLKKHSERDAKLQAQVDLWLIRRGLTNELSAKRRKIMHI